MRALVSSLAVLLFVADSLAPMAPVSLGAIMHNITHIDKRERVFVSYTILWELSKRICAYLISLDR